MGRIAAQYLNLRGNFSIVLGNRILQILPGGENKDVQKVM